MANKESNSVLVADWNSQGMSGPVFQGTQVPFDTLLDYFKQGKTMGDFLAAFPAVTKEQVLAALEYTMESVNLRQPQFTHFRRRLKHFA